MCTEGRGITTAWQNQVIPKWRQSGIDSGFKLSPPNVGQHRNRHSWQKVGRYSMRWYSSHTNSYREADSGRQTRPNTSQSQHSHTDRLVGWHQPCFRPIRGVHCTYIQWCSTDASGNANAVEILQSRLACIYNGFGWNFTRCTNRTRC